MFPWVPIVKKTHFEEPFVTEEKSRSIVGSVFVAVGVMIFASIVAILFYWSFQRDVSLFITILCGLVFLYSVMVVALVATMRTKMNEIIFKFYMGSTTFVAFLTLGLTILFGVKYGRGSSSVSRSSPYSSSYTPSPVVSYNSPTPV